MAGFVQEDGNWGEVGCAGGDEGAWGGGYGGDFRAAGDLCGEVCLGMAKYRYLISRLGREFGVVVMTEDSRDSFRIKIWERRRRSH